MLDDLQARTEIAASTLSSLHRNQLIARDGYKSEQLQFKSKIEDKAHSRMCREVMRKRCVGSVVEGKKGN